MKFCKECKTVLTSANCYKRSARCKSCISEDRKLYYRGNRQKILIDVKTYALIHKEQKERYNKEYQKNNVLQIKKQRKLHYDKNREKLGLAVKADFLKNKPQRLKMRQAWRKRNPHKINFYSAKRHAAKLQRIPKWLTKSDWIEIKWAYQIAKDLTKETGLVHEVDHIIPLQGKNISGLHCPQNLQILTKKENNTKNNKFPYTRSA